MENAFATEFTPWTAALGGLLIGLAASLLILSNGRIAGISGICGQLLVRSSGDREWRLCFLLGLPLGALAVDVFRGGLPIHRLPGAPRGGSLNRCDSSPLCSPACSSAPGSPSPT